LSAFRPLSYSLLSLASPKLIYYDYAIDILDVKEYNYPVSLNIRRIKTLALVGR
jgi:hypothetical protein